LKKEYVLKHNDIPVLTFYINEDTWKFFELGDIIDQNRLPYGIDEPANRSQNAIQLHAWLQGRGLPDSRKDKNQIKKQFNVEELQTLTMQAGGLNLTDHYWFHRTDKDNIWKNVNYFENTFDEVKEKGVAAPGIDPSVHRQSPNVCVDGSIEKRWIIEDGRRFLLKGSRYKRMQEPFNEMTASLILNEYNIKHVGYELRRTKDNIPYSICECICDENTEFLNAQWVILKEPQGMKDMYTHFLDICKKNGIHDVKKRMDEMMGLDFIIGNEDRHRGNFGILRNSQTLQWLNIVPIFDNGNSLFFDKSDDEIKENGIDSTGKAFGDSNRLNLKLLDWLEWYDGSKKDTIISIVAQSLKNNERLKSQRINDIIDIINKRLSVLEKIIQNMSPI
jgi:hypothetical protein